MNYLELTVSDEDEANAAQYNFDQTALQRFNIGGHVRQFHHLPCQRGILRAAQGVRCAFQAVRRAAASAIPSETVDEYGVYLRELELHFAEGFRRLPGNLIVCLRRSPEEDTITYGRTMEYWRANQLFFRNMFEYKHPTEE